MDKMSVSIIFLANNIFHPVCRIDIISVMCDEWQDIRISASHVTPDEHPLKL